MKAPAGRKLYSRNPCVTCPREDDCETREIACVAWRNWRSDVLWRKEQRTPDLYSTQYRRRLGKRRTLRNFP